MLTAFLIVFFVSGNSPIWTTLSLPTVIFTEEPKNIIVPFHGQEELHCKVNFSQATYTWFAVRYATVELQYKNGRIQAVKNTRELSRETVEVTESRWCHLHPNGRLVIMYPSSKDPVSLASFTNNLRTTRDMLVEGSYRCKANIPGYGSLLSKAADVRLSGLFFEPGISTTTAHVSVDSTVGHVPSTSLPQLGGGYFWPGEMVVLRCPILAISRLQPVFQWFLQSEDGLHVYPLLDGLLQKNGPPWPGQMRVTRLNAGQWLEVQLGRTNDKQYSALKSGFGNYFCKVHIPPTSDQTDSMRASLLNLSGPYIQVVRATYPSSYFGHVAQPVWAVTPDIVARVDPPLPPTSPEPMQRSLSYMNTNVIPLIWRHINNTITFPCAVNVRIGSNTLGSFGPTGAIGYEYDEDFSIDSKRYTLRWTKNYQAINYGVRFLSVGTGSLLIKSLQLDDSGIYQCELVRTDTGAVVANGSVKLAVGKHPDVLLSTANPLTGRSHANYSMVCEFSGHPSPQIEWRKNSEPVTSNNYFQVKNTQIESISGTITSVVYRTHLNIIGLLRNDAGYFQCIAQNRFGSVQSTITLLVVATETTYDRLDGTYIPPPRNPSVRGVTETQAILSWLPPKWLNLEKENFGYQVRMTSAIIPIKTLTVNTSKPGLLLTDLLPASTYNFAIYTLLFANGKLSSESATLHIRTKPSVRRPKPVDALTAESGEFRSLRISWRAPQPASNQSEDKISHYLITLFRLSTFKESTEPAHNSTIAQHQQITVPASNVTLDSDLFVYTATNLLPDSFYQISVQAMTITNTTGQPSVISSSPRVSSKAPTAPPSQVRVHSIGSQVATISWTPPPLEMRNGEIILYRLSIFCEDWLQPRQIVVPDKLAQRIQGFTRSTSYQVTVSAATRGGNGPESSPVVFNTTAVENSVDEEAKKHNDSDYYLTEPHRTKTPVNLQIPFPSSTGSQHDSRSVENLRCIADESSLLLLWSPPIQPISSTPRTSELYNESSIDHYLVRWGKLYPGPSVIKLDADQTRFLVNELDTDTSYLIDVAAVFTNGEIASAMVTGRTKPARTKKHLLIPLNLHVTSMGSDWAVLEWDKPECPQSSELHSTNTACLDREVVQSYQVAYRLMHPEDTYVTNRPNGKVEGTEKELDEFWNEAGIKRDNDASPVGPDSSAELHILNVSNAWIRLENLLPGQRYFAVVRTVGLVNGTELDRATASTLHSEWSLAERFETTKLRPEDAPTNIKLIGIIISNGSSALQISWQPPERPNGLLVGYLLYYTNNINLLLSEWHKVKLPANSVNTVLFNLIRNTLYFLQIRARNSNGYGPLSAVHIFRTADDGELGREILLDKVYYDSKSVVTQIAQLTKEFRNQKIDLKTRISMEGNTRFELSQTSWITIVVLTCLITITGAIMLGALLLRGRRQKALTTSGYQPILINGLKDGMIEKTSHDSTTNTRTKERTPIMTTRMQTVDRKCIGKGETNGSSLDRLNEWTQSAMISDIRTRTTNSVVATFGSAPRDKSTRKSPHFLEDMLLATMEARNRPHSQSATQTASGSSNSCTGSLGSPTRMTSNPTYQIHPQPFGFAVSTQPEATMNNSYAPTTLNVLPRNITAIVPKDACQPVPLSFLNGIASSSIMVQCYRPGELPTGSNALHMMCTEYPGRGQPPLHQFGYPCETQPSGIFHSADLNQNPTYVSVDAHFHATSHPTTNTPRVNAAELLSYTSLDDVRPEMSASVHTNKRLGTSKALMTRDIHEQVEQGIREEHSPRSNTHPAEFKQRQSPEHRSQNPAVEIPQKLSVERNCDNSTRRNCEELCSNTLENKAEGSKKVFSSEELSKEMENLEGLMKDLNAITRGEFNC